MKIFFVISIITLFLSQTLFAQTKKFDIILKDKTIPGKINQASIDSLSEPLKAILAYYSAWGGSNCNSSTCELTIALGLGEQGSNKHIRILNKWFKSDSTTQILIKNNCYQPPNTASSFSDYVYLKIELNGSNVIVKYSLLIYNHGKELFRVSKNDSYSIEKERIIVNKRKF